MPVWVLKPSEKRLHALISFDDLRILRDSDHPFSSEADHQFSRDSDQRSRVKPIAVLL